MTPDNNSNPDLLGPLMLLALVGFLAGVLVAGISQRVKEASVE